LKAQSLCFCILIALHCRKNIALHLVSRMGFLVGYSLHFFLTSALWHLKTAFHFLSWRFYHFLCYISFDLGGKFFPEEFLFLVRFCFGCQVPDNLHAFCFWSPVFNGLKKIILLVLRRCFSKEITSAHWIIWVY
jgi:hypothetical protein